MVNNGIYFGKQNGTGAFINPITNKNKTLHTSITGTIGAGRELKTVKIWCEKEFGIKIPELLIGDTQLYTHKEVWTLLDKFGIEDDKDE